MKKAILLLAFVLLSITNLFSQEIIIQENETGFCSVDGRIETSVAGYTGSGYADSDPGIGKSMSWEVSVSVEGTYSLVWRYGLGGNPGDRNARLLLNGNTVIDTIYFPHTGEWTNWTMSAPVDLGLTPGNYKIRIEAYSASGLGNYDYLKVIGSGVAPAECTPSYTINVKSNNDGWGTVSYEPVQNYYDRGTVVTFRAHAQPGYFFQSWTGEETSADSVFTFTVKSNVDAMAIFLPDGTTMDNDITGYASVQDDEGTPFIVIGGALGETVEANTLSDLQTYLGSPEPCVVKFSGMLEGTETITVSSNKTLIGTGETAHLKGIELSINDARNVIIRNITVSHVTPQDAVEINGQSKNVFIDHCEFYSDRDHGTEFYDGLLDIKNESSFITISWCVFHDHYKTSLISSGDQAVEDSVIRITYHHNYFYNCGSRLPSIRFGKAHIFNNYYKDCGTAINSRMGACVRVEKNYFENVGTAVMMEYSPEKGGVQLIDNHFGSSGVSTTPECILDVPYSYEQFLDETEDLPEIITSGVTSVSETGKPETYYTLSCYPNPFNSTTNFEFQIAKAGLVSLKVFDVLGNEVATLVNEEKPTGKYRIAFFTERFSSGIYFYQLKTGGFIETKKMILIK